MTPLDVAGGGAIATSAGGLWAIHTHGHALTSMISPATSGAIAAIASSFFAMCGVVATAYFAYKASQARQQPPPALLQPEADPDTPEKHDDPSQEA